MGNNELLLIDCICTPAGYAWRHTAGGPLSHRAAAGPLPPSLSRLCDPLNMHTNSPLVGAVVPGVPGPATGVGAPDGPGICGGCGTRARAACTSAWTAERTAVSRALVSPAATVTVPAVGDVLPVTDFAGALVVADCRLILGRRDDPRSDRRPCERRKVAAQCYTAHS